MMNPSRAAVVYDCNVYVQALMNAGGPAGSCVKWALDGRVSLFLSNQVLAEISEAPQKPTPARFGVSHHRTESLIVDLLKVATLVPYVPIVFSYERDPDDAHYVNLALAASATLIVSRDRDLLDLMDASRPEGGEFHRRFPALRILDPVQFLRQAREAEYKQW